MVQRQLPRPAELLELMQFKRPELDARRRRLDAALTIADLRAIAARSVSCTACASRAQRARPSAPAGVSGWMRAPNRLSDA